MASRTEIADHVYLQRVLNGPREAEFFLPANFVDPTIYINRNASVEQLDPSQFEDNDDEFMLVTARKARKLIERERVKEEPRTEEPANPIQVWTPTMTNNIYPPETYINIVARQEGRLSAYKGFVEKIDDLEEKLDNGVITHEYLGPEQKSIKDDQVMLASVRGGLLDRGEDLQTLEPPSMGERIAIYRRIAEAWKRDELDHGMTTQAGVSAFHKKRMVEPQDVLAAADDIIQNAQFDEGEIVYAAETFVRRLYRERFNHPVKKPSEEKLEQQRKERAELERLRKEIADRAEVEAAIAKAEELTAPVSFEAADVIAAVEDLLFINPDRAIAFAEELLQDPDGIKRMEAEIVEAYGEDIDKEKKAAILEEARRKKENQRDEKLRREIQRTGVIYVHDPCLDEPSLKAAAELVSLMNIPS